MSKFFNETRSVQKINPVPATANVDIQELVGSLKQGMENTNGTATQAEEMDLKHLLQPLKESHDFASQVAAGRLEKCRSIRLPRTEEKSFLVTQYNPSMQSAVEAYRTLRTRLVKQQTRSGARSLVVSSGSQGEGKTLTAFNLALCYANIQNWPVLLVDADLRTQGISHLMGDPESPGLAKILEENCPYQSAVLSTDVPSLYVLPAGKTSASPSELFSGAHWKEFMGWAAESFRLVIIDCPPVLNLADFELIAAAAESIMLVVRSRKTVRESLTKMLAQIDPRKLAGVVFNAAEEVKGEYQYKASAKAAGK
ncbi:MAG TPA: CpsD/CapB family tyrosine-protein kinase [Candidatus Sulfotelmatobacter sp.]|nr:CpsD/CapB family tyrosine-protein kinase [Candidatus Sulfotelmatobacter sp.]